MKSSNKELNNVTFFSQIKILFYIDYYVMGARARSGTVRAWIPLQFPVWYLCGGRMNLWGGIMNLCGDIMCFCRVIISLYPATKVHYIPTQVHYTPVQLWNLEKFEILQVLAKNFWLEWDSNHGPLEPRRRALPIQLRRFTTNCKF